MNRSLLRISWRISSDGCYQTGCPASGPSSGSAGSDGEYIAAASSGGDTESPAGGCEFTRARGVRIVPLRTTDIGTTDSSDASRKESGWRRMFFMWKVGSCCDSLPGLNESFPFMQPGWRKEKTPGGGGGGGSV